MSLKSHLLLVATDPLTTQIVSTALEDAECFEVEFAGADPVGQVTEATAPWDAVVVCAGREPVPQADLLRARELLGFSPLVVVTGDSTDNRTSLPSDILTLAASDFSARSLQLLLRAAGELKQANAKLASLEATASIKNDLLAQQNERIQTLASRLCHEVRSPLTAARQYTSLISRRQVNDADTTQMADRTLRSLDDLSMLVDDLSVLSQSQIPHQGVRRKVVSFHEIGGEIQHLLRERARLQGIDFEVRLEGDLPDVFADPDAVGQAVRNLVTNSLEHASNGQRVQLWAKPADDGQVTIGVEDQFDSTDVLAMEEVFREFCNCDVSLTSGFEGRRRGLAVARHLLAVNLSELCLESLGDRGSAFMFQLPSADPVRLVDHYLHVLRTRRPRTSLSLLTFASESSGPFAPDAAIDDFLQTSTTADDLVWQSGSLRWTALICGNQHETAGRLRLLDTMWELRRGRDQWLDLPAISWQEHGSWLLESSVDTIAREFLEACGVARAAAARAGRVLVVDNHAERVLRLAHQLEVAGFDVLVARDGDEAVSSAAQNHPDAIVWDADTSESREVSALQQIRRQDASHRAPIIMLASNMRQQQQALEHGAKAIFDQDLHANEVVEAVQRSLAENSVASVQTPTTV